MGPVGVLEFFCQNVKTLFTRWKVQHVAIITRLGSLKNDIILLHFSYKMISLSYKCICVLRIAASGFYNEGKNYN